MKLNKQKWLQEVRRVEAEIKELKKEMRKPYYQRTFSFYGYFQLKAEATRLYTLRRVLKGRGVELESFWHFVQVGDQKHTYCYHKKADKLTYEQAVSLILDGVPAWKASFLECPESPSHSPVPQPT